jgi:hypothetical protein
MQRFHLATSSPRRRYQVIAACAAFALSSFVTVQSAYAWEQYPAVLKEFGAPGEPPPCTICHISAAGGGEHTPFGKVIAANNTLLNLSRLRMVLEMLKANNTDTDKDGVSDMTEIAAGTDPSVPNAGPPAMSATPTPSPTPSPTPTVAPPPPVVVSEPPEEIEYGCVGSVAGQHSNSRGVPLLAALFVAVALWRTRSRAGV